MRVLLVEDEALIADAIQVSLQRAGYHVDVLHDGLTAQAALHSSEFDLLLLDLGLPGQDGLAVLRALRERGSSTPVIILTAREAIENRIEGLDLGADDYLTKPFDMDELLARCRVQLRRAHGRSQPTLNHGEIEIDPAARSVRHRGEVVSLSPLAYQVLLLLLERRGRVLSKYDLAESLYGWDDSAESNTVEVYISQLRKRLYPELIRTIRGVGYIIDPL